MEEKERFELFGEHCIKDNNPDARPQLLDAYVACVILNEQDKKIKAKEKEANTYAKEIVFLDNKMKLLERENQQLKQSQNQVAISELEKIYNLFEPYENSQKDTILCANNGISFIDYLENQIKSLKGEE